MAETLSPTTYNSLWHFRIDAWCCLEEEALRLTADGSSSSTRNQSAEQIKHLLAQLQPIEYLWAFPGAVAYQKLQRLFATRNNYRFARGVSSVNRSLVLDLYRKQPTNPLFEEEALHDRARGPREESDSRHPYFELLVVEDLTEAEEYDLRAELRRWQRPEDGFVYNVLVVPSFEDAVFAVRANFNLQACVIRRRFAYRSRRNLAAFSHFMKHLPETPADGSRDEFFQSLARTLSSIRPELDLYLMTEASLEEIAGRLTHQYRRVFHAREGLLELHLTVLRGIADRYRTPFFNALKEYSRRPSGVFHALPIAHGKSILNSHWIKDMTEFYGMNIFMAETSATCGGLDSLLEPTGPLLEAQQMAAETFGARHTYFVTNGTSTANKIVVQAMVRPGDIVLVDRNCHQSHHYGLVLAGAQVIYLDAYPLHEFSMYGAVPIQEIKRQLLRLRRTGNLDRVKMLMLTNCTFDGVVYDVGRVMEECLAIKPDLVFLWDEAWFAFARFHPIYRARTAMGAAQTLIERLHSQEFREQYAALAPELRTMSASDDELLERRLLPDPARARIRVYATQSTHKTLTSLRQGSMIHVYDQDFSKKSEETFREAYMAHTSTSPNYQILASLDLGRRQGALEGFELVQKQVEYAMRLRDAIDNHPLLGKYMRCLTTAEMIPRAFRPTGLDEPLRSGLASMRTAWEQDEFVQDPTRVTLYTGGTGIDGETFRREHLMDRYGVQINKTTRNTVLFMTNIGTTRSAVAYLIEVLVKMARELEDQLMHMSPAEIEAREAAICRLTSPSPLPNFSSFHEVFRESDEPRTSAGDVRRAFFLAYDEALCEYVLPDEVDERLDEGREVVSATFVSPYPPGFPVLVPGQVFSRDILSFMRGLDTKEIHGYHARLGYRVYTEKALEIAASELGGKV